MVNFAIGLALQLIAFLLTPRPKPPPPLKPKEYDVPRTEEGVEVMKVYGSAWCKGPHVVWFGHKRTKKIKEKSGGKK